MRRFALAAAAIVVIGAAGAIALRLTAPGPSEEDRVRRLLRDAEIAISEKRVGDAMGAVSERFRGNGLDRRELHRLLLAHVLQGAWVTVHVAAERIHVEGDAAEAVLLAIAARSGTGTRLEELLPADATALRIECRLERSDGTWRVHAARWNEIGIEEARRAAR